MNKKNVDEIAQLEKKINKLKTTLEKKKTRMTPIERECKNCGKTFIDQKTSKKVRKYCSVECRTQAANKRRGTYPLENSKKCLNCGDKIKHGERNSVRKFCSAECRTKYNNVKIYERRKEKATNPIISDFDEKFKNVSQSINALIKHQSELKNNIVKIEDYIYSTPVDLNNFLSIFSLETTPLQPIDEDNVDLVDEDNNLLEGYYTTENIWAFKWNVGSLFLVNMIVYHIYPDIAQEKELQSITESLFEKTFTNCSVPMITKYSVHLNKVLEDFEVYVHNKINED